MKEGDEEREREREREGGGGGGRQKRTDRQAGRLTDRQTKGRERGGGGRRRGGGRLRTHAC